MSNPKISLYESEPRLYQIVIDTDDLDRARSHMNTNSSWAYTDSFLTEIDGQIKSVFDIDNNGQKCTLFDFI